MNPCFMEESRIKILVIDDEPQNIEIVFTLLQQKSYDIFVATNGHNGFEIAKNLQPDVILLDWEMPEMSGIETIHLLKQDEVAGRIPIIMVTGKMTDSEDLQTALEAGAIDYVRKPIDKIELTARVGSVIAHEQEIRRNLELEKMLYEQKQQQLNFELEQNRRELLNIIVRFKQNCETYTDIAKKLNDLKTNTDQTGQNQINELIGAIKLNASAFDWNEFQVLFNGIHLNFFSSLQQAHPDLSANERKLCALLKLNMSSKTIATITFHSHAALKKARFRLRKKLNLNDTDNLSSYLQQF